MIIRMGEIAEACDPPPPCAGAVCACAGGGFAGAGVPWLPATCIPFFEPCENGNDFCSQCYSESGCAGGSRAKTGGDPGKRRCERKNGKIECHPVDE